MAEESGLGSPVEPSSLDSIREAQEAHERRVNDERETALAASKRQAELKARAGTDYGVHMDAVSGVRTDEAEIEGLKAGNIMQRMAESEALRGTRSEQAELLRGAQEELEKFGETLAGLEALVEGKDDELIAPTTKEALQTARATQETLSHHVQQIRAEIDKLDGLIVPDEVVSHYEALVVHRDDLVRQIDDLCINPDTMNAELMSLLENEAELENQVRNEIVEAAIRHSSSYSGYPSAERRVFLTELVQTFITEEIEARGMNNSREPMKDAHALVAWKRGVIYGLGQEYEQISRAEPSNQEGYLTGLVLHNLVGGYGTLGGTIRFMGSLTAGGINTGERAYVAQERERRQLPDTLRRHVRTLNLIKSYDEAIEDSVVRESIVGSTMGRWSEFDRDYGCVAAGYDNYSGGGR